MSQAFARGFMEVRLTGQQVELVWKTMQIAGCTPERALGYLLSIARGEMESGAWDGSTASQTGAEGVSVLKENMGALKFFSVGDMVVAQADTIHGRPQIIGHVASMDAVWAQLSLTKGTLDRLGLQPGDDLFPVRLEDLQEL